MERTHIMQLCRIFGGAKLDLISKGDQKLTFKDIEGIDQVKGEIKELVEFLKNPKRFIDLGARSPAGVLLVGAPGTGEAQLSSALYDVLSHNAAGVMA